MIFRKIRLYVNLSEEAVFMYKENIGSFHGKLPMEPYYKPGSVFDDHLSGPDVAIRL